MNQTEDTICALATAPMESGIGIIRISGKDALGIAGSFVRTRGGRQMDFSASRLMHYGFAYDGETPIDEVLAVYMQAPKSYTGEDTVEVHCHGGVHLMRKILELSERYGARPAEPGEFTKRAFLNGRMDLSRAEAVADLIRAESDAALRVSAAQLRGALSAAVQEMRGKILSDIAYIEAALDDPEHISLDGFTETLKQDVEGCLATLGKLLETAGEGKLLREGIRTVICGKPNAGKSSLLNALLGEERAIVTAVAGTTRDTVEEDTRIGSLNLRIIDTAGIHETEDPVERVGLSRAWQAVDAADLLLYVMDASVPLDAADQEIVKKTRNRPRIVLLNKCDLPMCYSLEEAAAATGCGEILLLSLKTGEGIGKVKERIESMFFQREIGYNGQVILTNERHKRLLENAAEALREVSRSIEAGMPEDFYTIDLLQAYRELGYILGEEVSEDVIDEIFSKFCIGK